MGSDFPFWLRASHLLNFVLMGMLIRSGVEMLSSLPRLWWANDCAPGKEWLKFTKRELPREEGVYTSLMDEHSVSPLLALPGRENIGLGRHWHGVSVMFWVANGLVYALLLFATGLWRRLVPTSWHDIPRAWHGLVTYLTLKMPPAEDFTPYDSLQKFGYSFIVFVLAPMFIVTGLGMTPAIRSRHPRYVKLLGGHQGARSLHFLCMVGMSLFIVMHVTLVCVVHPSHNFVHMVYGTDDTTRVRSAILWMALGVVAVVTFWVALSYWTLADRATAHRLVVAITEPGRKLFLNPLRPRLTSSTVLKDSDVSEFHWTNGLPPTEDESPEWLAARDAEWRGWTLTIGDDINGVTRNLTLDDLRQLPRTSYLATHTCMQGWSATSRWTGVRLSDLMDVLGPRPEGARYVLVDSYGLAQKMYDNRPREPFYACIDLATAAEASTILAYERNGHDLDIHLGAPARLRVESNHGYKHVKWVRSIRWIHDYSGYGDGRGGTREDSALQAFNGRI